MMTFEKKEKNARFSDYPPKCLVRCPGRHFSVGKFDHVHLVATPIRWTRFVSLPVSFQPLSCQIPVFLKWLQFAPRSFFSDSLCVSL